MTILGRIVSAAGWVLLAAISLLSGEPLPDLVLRRSLPVEYPENVELSGLAIYRGDLFTVSDKHSDTIFRIEIEKDRAFLVPAVRFDPPGDDKKLDLEGIAVDALGTFFLVSERMCRILRVEPDGSASWVTPPLWKAGEKAWLFRKKNAGLEGIALLGDRNFLLCAEREPRGLLEVDLRKSPGDTRAFRMDRSRLQVPSGIPLDFSDLCAENGTVHALARNSRVVVVLRRTPDGWEEGSGWSYKAVETAPEYRYSLTVFGYAEGLCMDERNVYVVLDNNGDTRRFRPTDRRPQLFIFERPAEMRSDSR